MALLANIRDQIISVSDAATWRQISLDFGEELLSVSLGENLNVFTDKLNEFRDIYGLNEADVTSLAGFSPDRPLPPTWLIWAEENSTLGNNSYEWAFGNGANSPASGGIVVPFGTWQLRGMSLKIGGTNGSRTATVRIRINESFPGQSVTVPTGQNIGTATFPEDQLIVAPGDLINFQTQSATGTGSPCVVAAAFERIS